MFSLRTHLLISGGLFASIILMGIGGNALQAAGVIKHPEALQTPMKIVFFTIFIAFAFSLVPTMVKLFVAGQTSIGNAQRAPIRFFEAHQVAVVWTIWIIWIAGMVVAAPTMIRSGFFTNLGASSNNVDDNTASGNSNDEIANQIAHAPVQGTLVAAPGMTMDEMIRGSTLKITPVPGQLRYAGGAIFNFRVAGTGIEFKRCRYYFITTYASDPTRIESINLGTAAAQMTRAELDAANANLRARLTADGWLAGHEVYRDEEDRQMHGGKTRGPEGKLWLKGDTTLDIEERRLDDPVAGEDPATAGEWIQYVDMGTRKGFPSIDRYVFAPPES